MRPTQKGNLGCCGRQAPSGSDADAGLTPTLRTTGASTAAGTGAHALLPGGEEEVQDTAGSQGAGRREEHRDPAGGWRTARQPGQRRRLAQNGPAEVRAQGEHPFLDVQRPCGSAPLRSRGLAQNTQRSALLLGFPNLLLAGRSATG